MATPTLGNDGVSLRLNDTAVAQRLRAIADELVLESSRASHWIARMIDGKGTQGLERANAALNAAFDPYVAEVAVLTGNSESTLRQVYGPKAMMQWFRSVSTTEFLRCVAQYETFSLSRWREKGWQGWGKHPELADPIDAHTLDQADKVEVFHWHVRDDLYQSELREPIKSVIMDIMRGKADVIADVLADSEYWLEQGLSYKKVAQVDGNDFAQAFSATNHIDGNWTNNVNVDRSFLRSLSQPVDQERSTAVGDIMRCATRFEVVAPIGFTSLPPQCSIWLDHVCSINCVRSSPKP